MANMADMTNIKNDLGDLSDFNANPDVIESEHHTLTWESFPDEFVPVDSDDPELQGIYTHIPNYKMYKLFIGPFQEDSKGLHKIFNELQKAGFNDVLEIHISSQGGYIHELIQFYSVINAAFGENIVTYLDYGYSSGAMMFLFGKKRIVYEYSDFLLHSYSSGFFGKRNEVLSQLEHTDKRIQKFMKKMLKPYLSKKEIKRLSKGEDFWMDSHEMLKRGIATHIIIGDDIKSREEYLGISEGSEDSD